MNTTNSNLSPYRKSAHSISTNLMSRLGKRLRRSQFLLASKAIVSTPQLTVRPGALTILSMVQNRDVYMYLGAVKSLYRALGEGEVVIVNDGSLQPAQLELIRHHIPSVDIIALDSVDTGRCPRGGTWERLVLIHELTRKNYVIQMDSDTLTLGSAEAVQDAYRSNVSFGLGTSLGRAITPAREVAELAKQMNNDDISVRAERDLGRLRNSEELKYLRGSSGFAGFARGAFDVDRLEDFSDQLRVLLGSRWDEWGSEQVASNFTVANAPNARVLPYPDYSCHYPHTAADCSKHQFAHFIGTHRFDYGTYVSQFSDLVRELHCKPTHRRSPKPGPAYI